MCKIKSGELLENYQDIKNMIVGILLRQQTGYSVEHIVNLAFRYCDGAQVEVDTKKLKDMVENSIEILDRNDDVYCEGGLYVPKKFQLCHVIK